VSGRDGDLRRLLEAARAGDDRSLARLISIVEDGGRGARELSRLVTRSGAGAFSGGHLVGITGAPGVGKSTAVAALVDTYRSRGRRVAVLAVDPSSPRSGGALLGDRVRMQRHALDRSVFIRSLSTRGRLGGLSAAVPGVLAVVGACNFDVVVVETVGVGQMEVDIARLADTVVVIVAPGGGDSVQLAKAGLLEVADVLVVSKADLDGATALRDELRRMLALAGTDGGTEPPPVLLLAAATRAGASELVEQLDAHLAAGRASGVLGRRRLDAAAARIEAICRELIAERAGSLPRGSCIEALSARVLAGELDAYDAADELLAR
jgi:LAO/AO transport system kinase